MSDRDIQQITENKTKSRQAPDLWGLFYFENRGFSRKEKKDRKLFVINFISIVV